MMSQEKQIEEMFNIIADGVVDGEDNHGVPTGKTCLNIAQTIYDADYRKQSVGEWLHDTKWDTFYCSICDESALNDCYEHQILSGYCPHCGAKMGGGE